MNINKQSRSFEERRKRRVIFGSILGAAGIAAWLFVLHTASYSQTLALTDVRVYGAEADVTPTLRAAAYRMLQGTYLGLFSKANILFYPKGAIMAAVGAASPRIGGVTVTRDGLHGLTIAVAEKNPAAVACAGLPNFDDNGALLDDVSSSGDCYFADEAGRLFKKLPVVVPDSYNRYYVPTISDDPIGRYATSTETFRSLQAFVAGARSTGIMPGAILVKSGGEYELYVRNPGAASSTAIVYFNDAASLQTELSNLSAFWNSMTRAKRAASAFEYIDVRYGSNVFYRLIQ